MMFSGLSHPKAPEGTYREEVRVQERQNGTASTARKPTHSESQEVRERDGGNQERIGTLREHVKGF